MDLAIAMYLVYVASPPKKGAENRSLPVELALPQGVEDASRFPIRSVCRAK
jgi:hypothetical protein